METSGRKEAHPQKPIRWRRFFVTSSNKEVFSVYPSQLSFAASRICLTSYFLQDSRKSKCGEGLTIRWRSREWRSSRERSSTFAINRLHTSKFVDSTLTCVTHATNSLAEYTTANVTMPEKMQLGRSGILMSFVPIANVKHTRKGYCKVLNNTSNWIPRRWNFLSCSKLTIKWEPITYTNHVWLKQRVPTLGRILWLYCINPIEPWYVTGITYGTYGGFLMILQYGHSFRISFWFSDKTWHSLCANLQWFHYINIHRHCSNLNCSCRGVDPGDHVRLRSECPASIPYRSAGLNLL